MTICSQTNTENINRGNIEATFIKIFPVTTYATPRHNIIIMTVCTVKCFNGENFVSDIWATCSCSFKKVIILKLTVNLPNVNPTTNIPIIEVAPYIKLVLKHKKIIVPKSKLITKSWGTTYEHLLPCECLHILKMLIMY